MKRLITLLFTAALVVGIQAPAWAVDVKVSGTWEIGIGWADNTRFTDAKQGGHDDAFGAAQRIRPRFEFIADETLKSVLEFELGTIWWGDNDKTDSGGRAGGGLNGDGYEIKVRRAYLDWSPVADLNLRMGLQLVSLPSAAFGNPVLDAIVAGVVANHRFTDNVSLTAFWLRPFDQTNGSAGQTNGKNRLDEMDMFGLTLPIMFEGISFTPWAMYARTGNESGYWEERAGDDHVLFANGPLKGSSNMWWAGAAFELDLLSPFSLKLDAMYGQTKSGEAPEASGFLVAGLFEYKSEQPWGNPGLLGWYASGDGADDYKDGKYGKYGRMPIVGNDNAGFAPVGYGFPGSMGCMQDGLISNSGVGTWGVGLQLDEMSFFDNFSHTLRAAYIRGTNNTNMVTKGDAERFGEPYNIMGDEVYLTTKDHAVEFDFVTTWAAHPNLNIYLETNYIIMDLDANTWGSKNSNTTNAWKAQLLFEYSF